MADTKISALTLDATPATSDELAIQRGGTANFRTSVANLLAVSHTHVATTDLTATGTKNSTTFLRGDDTWDTPAGGGLWTEAGITTLGSAADNINLTSLTLKKYVKIIIYIIADGTNTVATRLTFNGDVGTNYTLIKVLDGGAAAKSTGNVNFGGMSVAFDGYIYAEYNLVHLAAEEKAVTFALEATDPGLSSIGQTITGNGKWVNTSDLITSMNVATATNDYQIGSLIQVLHHD